MLFLVCLFASNENSYLNMTALLHTYMDVRSHSSELGDKFYAVSSSLILVRPLWVRIPESLPTEVVNCVVLCIVCV
jgi:hypothetical protein